MADKSLFGRLQRLFSTNVIVRNVGGRKLKVADVDKRQAFRKVETNFLHDRYTRLHNAGSSYAGYGYDQRANQTAQRLEMFQDYESMDADPIIASALDVYSDESTMKNEFGNVLEINTQNEKISSVLKNLFYDVLNIEFNLWPWIRNMVKYGDFYLHLEIADKYGVTNVSPMSVYEVERHEGDNEDNPEEVKFKVEGLSGKAEYENYEVAHFRLLSDSNALPYGRSMVEGARRVWKQLTLMEDAMLIHRIMRAPEKRIFKLDIGNIPPNEVDNYMQQVINKMKKTPFIDNKTGDYNLKYNMQNITEDFFLPVRGGDSGTSIETTPGLSYEAIEDVEYLRNKMLAALKIPKAFLGYEEQVNAKATLAAEDVRFARTIERIQRIVVSELTKIAVVHLYSQGFNDEDLVNFELSLTNSSTIYEQEKITLWNEKISLASSMLDAKVMSTDWVYKNIFNMDDDLITDVRNGVIDDQKRKFRFDQIEQEGNDPVKTKESFGTPHDLAQLQMSGNGDDASPPDEGGAPEEGFEGAGRPKEFTKYRSDKHPRGRDPLGQKDYKLDKDLGNLSTEAALKHIGKLLKRKNKKVLSESLEIKGENDKKEKNISFLDEKNIILDDNNE